MSRDQTTADVTERLLQTDIGLLNDHNVSDDTMSILAAEHAARTETLAKAIDPTLCPVLMQTS